MKFLPTHCVYAGVPAGAPSPRTTLAAVAAALAAMALAGAAHAAPRDTIHIAGSSTVYPFSSVAAERFGKLSRHGTPVVESVGTGGGFKLFCEGLGTSTTDISNASRRIKLSEFDLCQKNGVVEIVEIKIGYDGIVLANARERGPAFELTRRDIYLALAKDVPDPGKEGAFTPNPHRLWSDVNRGLPKTAIRVLGPPPTSGTRDAFVELAMEGGCAQFPFVKAMKKRDKKAYKARCHSIREDGAYIQAGENDNLIVQKLAVNPDRLGIFGFSFLVENRDKVKGLRVDGHAPDFENVMQGRYPVSRSLYFYVKKAHAKSIPGLEQFVRAFTSKRAIGEEGYLADRGLIPLGPDEYRQVRKTATQMIPLERSMLEEH